MRTIPTTAGDRVATYSGVTWGHLHGVRIYLAGPRTCLDAAVRAADLIVLTGHYENDANVLAQAQRCGTPAVPLRALVQS